ncbi:hypothetical protein [Vitreimonas sp.]|uniref:hypothetical protein n=1 Tax=Vitreimonas sp. TaxID=3069702 RepID=UPI002EDA8725
MGGVSQITTVTGRELELRELTQTLTYGGLLEGLPTRKRNQKYLEHVLARHQAVQHPPVFLLTPVETAIELEPGEVYPFGEPATLARITCVGLFRSKPVGGADPIFNRSELRVIWLQNEFALPIEPSIMDELSKLDWDSLAANFEL